MAETTRKSILDDPTRLSAQTGRHGSQYPESDYGPVEEVLNVRHTSDKIPS